MHIVEFKKCSSSDALIIYDSKRKKGELIVEEYGNVFRRVYYFDENEILIIKSNDDILFNFKILK